MSARSALSLSLCEMMMMVIQNQSIICAKKRKESASIIITLCVYAMCVRDYLTISPNMVLFFFSLLFSKAKLRCVYYRQHVCATRIRAPRICYTCAHVCGSITAHKIPRHI